MKRSLLVLALAACGSSPPKATKPAPPPPTTPAAPVASPGPDATPLPLWAAVKKGVLPNGLTYYILPHHKPEKRALLWLAINAGSVQEDDDQRGLAHFDEHMAFNGTKRFPKNAIVSYLESIGMRFGADLNAYTTWEQTVYQLEVPTDRPEFVGKGLDILRDWAGDVTYDPEEVAKERGVVKEEWRLGRGAGMRLFDKQAKALFKGTRYADRITIGLPEIIDKAPREALYRYYKDWYRPDLMAVIAVGDFADVPTIEKEIAARFGDLKAPAKERKRPSGGVPVSVGTRVSIETDREATSTVVTIDNLAPHRSESSKTDYRRLVVESLYSQILNQRFSTIGRKPDSPFLGAAGGVQSLVRDIDAFARFAQAKQGKLEETLRTLLTEIVRIERHGITQGELDRARANMKRTYEQSADTEETTDSRGFTDEITRNFFEGELMIGRKAERDLTLEMLPTITLAELNQLGKSFGGADTRTILISGPDGKPMPDQKRVMEIVAEVEKAEVPAWEDKASTQPLMDKPPTPGKIVKEKRVNEINVTEWTLSNGARVIVKPTDFEQDAFAITGTSPGGEATVSDKDWTSARFADEVVSIGGLGNFDVDTLQKMLAGKAVHYSSGIGETIETIDAGGSAKDAETIMQLLYLRMTAPRKDEQQFGIWKANYREQLDNAMRSPDFRWQRDSTAVLWKNHVRRKTLEPADLDKVDLDKALAFYKDRYGDATDFTFVIVGAVDLAQLRPLVETYLASLPAKARKEKEKDLKIRRVGGVVNKTFNFGTEDKAAVSITFHGDETWTRDKDRDIFILGQVLSIRLREAIREDKSGVYGIGANGSIARTPHQERTFSVRFGCDPKRVDELVKDVFDNIAFVEKEGVPPDVLDKVKQTFLRSRETELRRNGFWLGWLATAYRFGDDPTIVLDTTKMTDRMTSKNVVAAAKRYIDLKQSYQSVLMPEKK